MIGAQFKTGHVTLTTPFRGLSVIRRLAKIANAFERSGQSLKIAHSPWGSAPHLLRGSLGPPESSFKTACRSVQPFFCTAHRRMCHYIAMGRYVRPPNSHPLTTPRLTTPTKSGAQTGTPSYLWMKLRTWCADRPWWVLQGMHCRSSASRNLFKIGKSVTIFWKGYKIEIAKMVDCRMAPISMTFSDLEGHFSFWNHTYRANQYYITSIIQLADCSQNGVDLLWIKD